MGVTETVAQINQACADLKQSYAVLAGEAAPAMDRLNSSVGRLTQWKCTSTANVEITHQLMVTYYDAKPRWYELLLRQQRLVGEVPHPRADEARAEVAKLFGTAAANDEKFELDVQDIAATPEAMGKMITAWLVIAEAFSREVAQVIPSDLNYIPTSGGLDGWVSPTASGAYKASASSQNKAADTTSAVMSALMDNCASFLTRMQSHLAALAAITAEQNTYLTNIITGATLPDKPTFDGVMKLIKLGVTIVQGLDEEEKKLIAELGSMANDTITALLKIADLDRQITEMGETPSDNGWPMPASINLGLKGSSRPSCRELRYNGAYFKDHIAFWQSVSTVLSQHASQASGVPTVPVMFTRVPTFSADQSTALAALSGRIATDALGKGATATTDLSQKLSTTLRAYLDQEAENTALADEIWKELFG